MEYRITTRVVGGGDPSNEDVNASFSDRLIGRIFSFFVTIEMEQDFTEVDDGVDECVERFDPGIFSPFVAKVPPQEIGTIWREKTVELFTDAGIEFDDIIVTVEEAP